MREILLVVFRADPDPYMFQGRTRIRVKVNSDLQHCNLVKGKNNKEKYKNVLLSIISYNKYYLAVTYRSTTKFIKISKKSNYYKEEK